MDYLIAAASFVGLILLFFAIRSLALRQDKKCAAIIREWATENGLRIVERAYVALWRGPFWLRRWYRDHAVYRVVVEDAEGKKRIAHVRISGWLWPKDLSVRWEQEETSAVSES